MVSFQCLLFGIICAIGIVRCFEIYQYELPNGFNIPNPCDPGAIWNGVGHYGPEGQGSLNKFGKDFLAAGKRWTKKLCKKDSDGDGKTNGEEIGDPFCRWQKETPNRLQAVKSHPGICEPWDNEICRRKNGSVVCPNNLKCKVTTKKTDPTVTVRLPLTLVPKKNFTYACMVVNIPANDHYHLVEATPLFYNRRVLHHMTIYACDPKFIVRVSGKPFECPKVTTAPCQEFVTTYNPDFPITCLHEDVGIYFGLNGTKQVVLQVLWSNPSGLDYEDSSGMLLKFSSALRPHTAGVATIDSTVFQIPPGIPSYPVVGGCPRNCNIMRINKEVKISMVISLMHKLGRNQTVELIRNGTVINYLTRIENFDHSKPNIVRHLNPIQVLPGDSIRMICEYNSTHMTTPVKRGLGEDQEICRAQLLYYPRKNWDNPSCLGFKHVPLCLFETVGGAMGCHYQDFLDSLQREAHYNTTIATCSLSNTCSAACLHLVSKERQHPCLRGELYELWNSNLIGQPDPRLVNLYKALVPCAELYEQNAHLVPSRGRIRP